MEDNDRSAFGRRNFLRASALGAAAAAVPVTSARAALVQVPVDEGSGATAHGLQQPKYQTRPVDMSRTYVNPVALPLMDVRRERSSMSPTDAGIGSTTRIREILAKESWTAADGRDILGPSKDGFRLVIDNAVRTVADFSAVNYDGTIYVYASGNIQDDGNRVLYSTRDYVNWDTHTMNVGVVAPTAVRVGDRYYLAGNSTPVYVSDSPTGPWRDLGPFTRPDGSTFGAGDVQFFLDDDGRLYLTWNIGAPLLAAELDPEDPRQLITEPKVIVDFDPYKEWMHFGDNKQAYNFGYVEAPQIFKVGGHYYLQVASGGTEHTTYSTGIFKSTEGPLTGYVEQAGNPVGRLAGSTHPSASYPDAGHGSFVQDDDGNLVFFYTYVIAHEGGLERRMGMDVCEIDARGNISCRLTNTPQLAPNAPRPAGNRSGDAGLYNLATNSQAYWASSYAPGRTPYYATDRSLATWWEPANDADGSTPFGIAGSIASQVEAITASAENSPNEVAANLNDVDPGSKWLAFTSTGWVQYRLDTPTAVVAYALTSGNDEPGRDPKSWTLQGSDDGTTWTPVDTQTDEMFADRAQTRRYAVANPTPYLYYRLDVTANNGASITQLAELQLSSDLNGPVPSLGDMSPTFIVGLSNPYYVSAVQIQWKELGFDFTAQNAVKFLVEYRDLEADRWTTLVDRRDNTTAYAIDYMTFGTVLTHAVRVSILGTTENVRVGIQEIGVFGENYTLAAEKGMLDLAHEEARPSLEDLRATLGSLEASGDITRNFARYLSNRLDHAIAAQAAGNDNASRAALRQFRDKVSNARPPILSANAQTMLLDMLKQWLP